MSSTDELVPVLKKLRLSGVLETLDLRLRQMAEENIDPVEFLFRLLHDEVERRDSKQLRLRLGRAGFEHGRTLEDFDFTFNPVIPKAKIVDLATCTFVERHENLLLIGQAGVGKSVSVQPTPFLTSRKRLLCCVCPL
jgi:DNA replication protein DnaC